MTKANAVRSKDGLPALSALSRLVAQHSAVAESIAERVAPSPSRAAKVAVASCLDDLAVASTNASEEKGDAEQEDEEEDEEGEEGEQGGDVFMGVALNAQAVADSMSVVQSGSGLTKRKGSSVSDVGSVKGVSPGAKSRRVAMANLGVPLQESEKQSLVDRRIASASVQKVLEGEAMGREIRWCRETRDHFRNANEVHFAEMLDEHFRLCNFAETLAEGPIHNMPKNQLEVAARAVQDAGESFPIKMQWLLLRRAVTQATESLDSDSAVAFMRMVCPWPVGDASSTGNDDKFDGLNPRLSDITVPVEEKKDFFLVSTFEALSHMVKKGAKGKGILLEVCAGVLKFLIDESVCDSAELYDLAVSYLLMACRTLKCLADPFCSEHTEAVSQMDKMCGKKDKQTKSTPIYGFWMCLKASDFWWALHEEHVSLGSLSMTHVAEIQEFTVSLKAGTLLEGGGLLRLLKRLPAFAKECRPGMIKELELAGEETLKQHLEFLKSRLDIKDTDCPGTVAAALDLLDAAMAALPRARTSWEEGKCFVQGVQAKLAQAQTIADFEKLAKSSTIDTFGDIARYKELGLAIRLLVDAEAAPNEEHGKLLRHVADLCLQWLATKADSAEAADAPLEVMTSMMDSCSWAEMGQNEVAALRAFKAWRPLTDAVAQFKKSGGDMPTRLAAPQCMNLLVPMLSAYKECAADKEFLQQTSGFGKFVKEQSGLLDVIFEDLLSAAHGELKDAADAIEPSSRGGPPDEFWSKTIQKGDEDNLDAVMKVAQETLGQMNGPVFEKQLDRLIKCHDKVKRLYEIFDTQWNPVDKMQMYMLIARCKATKFEALLAHAYHEDKASPNPAKLRRKVRKYFANAKDIQGIVYSTLWRWCLSAESF